MIYNIKLEKFDGPLDLMLSLIENEKMDVNEISLSKITDDYLAQLEKMEKINPSFLADFLLVAAQLILIKSKTLLPGLELTAEEEISSEELKKRLIEYKKFKDVAVKLGEMYNNKYISFGPKNYFENAIAFYPGKNLNLESLTSAASDLLNVIIKYEKLEQETIKSTISIKDRISHLKSLIETRLNIRFNDVVKNSKNRGETVVSFLALLELVKQKVVKAEQSGVFGDIVINK